MEAVRVGRWTLYLLLLSLVTLLNIAFTLLRSARSALAVADVGGAAALIPYYELLGTVPGAIVLTWLLARLLRVYSLPTVFYLVLSAFLTFFLFYTLWLYPLWRSYAPLALATEGWWAAVVLHVPALLFFAVAELWKVALLSILLWGYLNQKMLLGDAKAVYAPLMLGTSLGAMLAQPLTAACSAFPLLDGRSVDRWHAVLSTQLVAVMAIGLASAGLFWLLVRRLGAGEVDGGEGEEKMGLVRCVRHSWESSYLRGLATIIVVDYIVYSLVEVIFLEKLKERYPDPTDYCGAMAQLAQWGGALTAVTALVVGPQLLRRLPWTVTALVTPVVVGGIVIVFLGVVIAQEWGWLTPELGVEYAVAVGSAIYCVGRATKYALLDSAKELAFIPLSKSDQLQGKLAIEALASRGGRGVASMLSIALVGSAGTFAASAPTALAIAMGSIWLWVKATCAVGRQIR